MYYIANSSILFPASFGASSSYGGVNAVDYKT